MSKLSLRWITLAAATITGCATAAAQNPILGYFSDGHYRSINATNGDVTVLAYAPGGTKSWRMIVDPSISTAYRIAGFDLLVTDLVSQKTRAVTITGIEQGSLRGCAAYTGRLIANYGGSGINPGTGGAIYLIDPITGVATKLLDRFRPTVNGSLSIDPVSNRLVRFSNLFLNELEVIDLNSLEVERVNLDQTPTTVDFFSGRAIGYFGLGNGGLPTYREINLRTGVTTFMANSPSRLLSYTFTVDAVGAPPETGTAYALRGDTSGNIAVTDLFEGQNSTLQFETGVEAELWRIDAHGIGSSARSFLQPIRAIERTLEGTKIAVPLVNNRQVGIEYSDDFSPGQWLDLGNVSEDGLDGAFLDPDPTRRVRPKGYYRAFLRP